MNKNENSNSLSVEERPLRLDGMSLQEIMATVDPFAKYPVFDLPDAQRLWVGFTLAFLETDPFIARWSDGNQWIHEGITRPCMFEVIPSADNKLTWQSIQS